MKGHYLSVLYEGKTKFCWNINIAGGLLQNYFDCIIIHVLVYKLTSKNLA